jgi:DNA repair exonuclease SbcCD ATPase subunit
MMSNEWPKMMYHDHPEYKVAHNHEEAVELQKLGYVFEVWGTENTEQIEQREEQAPIVKVDTKHCPVCGKHLRKFSHKKCREEKNALAGA